MRTAAFCYCERPLTRCCCCPAVSSCVALRAAGSSAFSHPRRSSRFESFAWHGAESLFERLGLFLGGVRQVAPRRRLLRGGIFGLHCRCRRLSRSLPLIKGGGGTGTAAADVGSCARRNRHQGRRPRTRRSMGRPGPRLPCSTPLCFRPNVCSHLPVRSFPARCSPKFSRPPSLTKRAQAT